MEKLTRRFPRSLACLVLAVAATAALPALRADDAPEHGAKAPASPAAVYEAELMGIAPKCVATTVGLVGTVQNENSVGIFSGSGVVVSPDGLILTAGHVAIKPGTALNVRFSDGRVVQGISLGIDHLIDTGLARITDPAPEGGWPFSEMAPADSAKIGEWVIAAGNPGSVVVGRNPPLRIGRVTKHDAKIVETNCAMEPGDSGGPLFDLSGRVVGINSRIMTTQGEIHMRDFVSVHVPISQFASQWKWLLAKMNAHPDANLNSGPRPGGPRAQGPRPEGSRPDARRDTGDMQKRFKEALDKLVSRKDPQTLKMLADARKNGGNLTLSPDDMEKLIRRAAWLPSTTQPASNLPTTNPSLASSNPATTQPTTQPALADAAPPAASPSAPPSTQPAPNAAPAPIAQKGIAWALRPFVGPQIKKSLLQQFPGAKISDELLQHIMDKSSFDLATRRMNIGTDFDDLKAMGVSEQAIAAGARIPGQSNRTGKELSKSSLQTLALFAPALDAAGDCVVEIRSADKPVLLGTIVDADGWIVTKASDLPDDAIVVLPSGQAMKPKTIGKDDATDLALLKIDAHGLTAVKFTDSAPLGAWLASPTADPDEPQIGIVSITARPIPDKFLHFNGEKKVFLGLGFSDPNCVIGQLMPGMPAVAAGMMVGDKILSLDGQDVSTSTDFVARTKKATPGQTLLVKVLREGKEIELKLLLGQAKANTITSAGIGEADNFAGGKLSKRRTNFPMALQTDSAIWADQCGGPLVNLQGQAVGINIARYDRVCTFTLPADLVQKTIAKLREGKQG